MPKCVSRMKSTSVTVSMLCFLLVNDVGDARITSFSILPATGRQGTTFTIDMTYTSMNGTGTGQMVFAIETPDRVPVGNIFLMEAKLPGTYKERITIKAEPEPGCDIPHGKMMRSC
jgi:hypothetical protein